LRKSRVRTQAYTPAHPSASQPELERNDLEISPLGVIGNLRFTAKQGGTGRISCIRASLSGIGRALVHRLSDLKDYFMSTPAEKRALREYRYQVRNNSLFIGNLLGRLTAPAGDFEGRVRTAEALKQLVRQPDGKSIELKGLDYCVAIYVDELKDSDLEALRQGVLGDKDACMAVVNKIKPADGYEQACELINCVSTALNRRRAREIARESLGVIADQLQVPDVDRGELKKAVLRLARSMNKLGAERQASSRPSAGGALDGCLRSLPATSLQRLRTQLRSGRLEEAQQVILSKTSNSSAARQMRLTLDQLRAALWRVIHSGLEV